MPRPNLPEGQGKGIPLNMRTTPEIRGMLEAAAAASGRSLVQDVGFRITQSFEQDRLADMVKRAVAEVWNRDKALSELAEMDADHI